MQKEDGGWGKWHPKCVRLRNFLCKQRVGVLAVFYVHYLRSLVLVCKIYTSHVTKLTM